MNRTLKIQINSLKELAKVKELLGNEPIFDWKNDYLSFNNLHDEIVIIYFRRSTSTKQYNYWDWKYSRDIDFIINYTTFINLVREEKFRKILENE